MAETEAETDFISEEKEAKEGKGLSEESTGESDYISSKKIDSPKIDPILKEKLKDIPEALEYIEKLENLIKKQIKKIQRWKRKFKKKRHDVATQTNDVCDIDKIPKEDEIESVEVIDVPKSITEDIKEAAEMAMQKSGFVYEETSGMYYDYNTGYYYNAEYGLYYDGNTGTYLKYNEETQTYDFHSQVTTPSESNNSKVEPRKSYRKTKRKKAKEEEAKEWKRTKRDDEPHQEDFEEGEILSVSSDCSDSSSDVEMVSNSSEMFHSWPPCMRIIIESSENPKIKVASLHIITCDGGTLGREGNHSIILPDQNISKHHLKFEFDKEASSYRVTDFGSRNGTLLNGKRMSPSKQESDPMEVTHGSRIQLGSTVLLCHIHDGSQTCGHCEPGLIQPKTNVSETIQTRKEMKISANERYKNELKKLKKQCGFIGTTEHNTKLASGYTDRAQKRRETVGSQNPHEKTKMASVDESITSENKGFKLLSKMGWKEGQSLGKAGDGLTEPINVVGNVGTTGIGAESVIPAGIHNNTSLPSAGKKQNIWKKTQERFEKIPDTVEVSDDED